MQVLKIAVVSACFAALVSPVVAQGQKKGFGEETEVTLGNSGKPQKFEGQGGEGTTTTTTTGPKGQLKQDECQSPNCETEVTDRPGRSN